MEGRETVSGIHVIVPMRPLASCKRRLASAVPDDTREALVLLMLSRTVRAVLAAVGSGRCQVIGGDEPIRQVAAESGAEWLEDREAELNATVQAGMNRAYRDGASAAMFLPADVPMVAARDVRAVVDASEDFSRPAGVEAQADGGTNALLVPAGIALAPALGHASYRRHQLQAERLGTSLAKAGAPGLAFDLDLPADLVFAREQIPGFASELSQWERRVRLLPGERARSTVSR